MGCCSALYQGRFSSSSRESRLFSPPPNPCQGGHTQQAAAAPVFSWARPNPLRTMCLRWSYATLVVVTDARRLDSQTIKFPKATICLPSRAFGRRTGALLDGIRGRLSRWLPWVATREMASKSDLFSVIKYVKDVTNVFGRPHEVQKLMKVRGCSVIGKGAQRAI